MQRSEPETISCSVLPEQEGWTVENVLKRGLHFTMREIRHAKYIPNGILKNGVSCRTTEKVHTGDVICFFYGQSEKKKTPETAAVSSAEMQARVQIFLDDPDFCVADKPSGMVCHASHGHFSDSLTHAAAVSLHGEVSPDELRCVGRLDKDTSGLVLFAKNRLSAARLSRQRESGQLQKEYLALAHFPFPEEERRGTIRFPMEQIPEQESGAYDQMGKRVTRMRICAEGTGLAAETQYEVVLQDASFAVVRCRLKTGRTHQIRLHMAAIGHPLFGDPLYGIPDGGSRAALHAWKLQFLHPITGKSIGVECFRDSMFE